MKTIGRGWLALVLAVALNGCGGGSSRSDKASNNPSGATASKRLVGPNLNGKWEGTFTVIGDGLNDSTPLTATIRHTGNSVYVKTSLVGIGANLTGTINAVGDMYLTDAYDGETWTTHFGPASSTSVRIADFAEDPSLSDDPAIEVIDLVRASSA